MGGLMIFKGESYLTLSADYFLPWYLSMNLRLMHASEFQPIL